LLEKRARDAEGPETKMRSTTMKSTMTVASHMSSPKNKRQKTTKEGIQRVITIST